MELFDLHADIGYDVMQKRKKGMRNIVNTFHIDKLQKGGINFVNMVCNFEGHETWEDMKEMILALKEEIQLCERIDIVYNRDDLLHMNGHMKAILSVEGMCGIQEDVVNKIEWLYQQGIRIGSLCWNDENALATGVKGNPLRGLTTLGKDVIEKMIALHMMVDVSHTNEKTFWDIMEYKNARIIATHSNARALCDHPRNLWDDQIKAIQEHNGIIGVVSAPPFVAKEKKDQDIEHFLQHAQYMASIIGYDRVGFGFDYMDFYEGYEDFHLVDLNDASSSLQVLTRMETMGFETEHIQMLALGNVLRYISENI